MTEFRSCIRRVEEGSVNELTENLVVNLDGLGKKAKGLPRQALDPCPEVQVLPLNALGRAFGDQVLVFRQVALIRRPAISAVQGHVPRFDQG